MRALPRSSFKRLTQVCANHLRARTQAAQAQRPSNPSLSGEPGKHTFYDVARARFAGQLHLAKSSRSSVRTQLLGECQFCCRELGTLRGALLDRERPLFFGGPQSLYLRWVTPWASAQWLILGAAWDSSRCAKSSTRAASAAPSGAISSDFARAVSASANTCCP